MHYKLERVKYWFLHRFHPRHRYHILKLGPPGYSDPRQQMIDAVMGIVDRYVDELRESFRWIRKEDGTWQKKDVSHWSDIEVVDRQMEWLRKEYEDDPYIKDIESDGWMEHYRNLRELLVWWEKVKDSDDLDCHDDYDWKYMSEFFKDKEMFDLTKSETVDEMLKFAISLRTGMWT